MNKKAVFGLGNPGDRYKHTRHNIGAEALLTYIGQTKKKIQPEEDGFSMVYAFKNHLCLLPQTYMNLSGVAVADAVEYHQLDLDDCLIVYDDVDIPLGQLRIRESGGPGGQNGMKSIIGQLGTRDFPRMRIGIGQAEFEGELGDFVLDPFERDEQALLTKVLYRAAEAIKCFLDENLQTSMNRFNGPV